MPVHQVLRLGRGAVIELDAGENDEVRILANDFPVAKGSVVVSGNRIAVEVKRMLPRTPDMRGGAALDSQKGVVMVLQGIHVSGKLRRARDNAVGGRRGARRTRALVATEAICYMLRRRSTPGPEASASTLPMRSWRNW